MNIEHDDAEHWTSNAVSWGQLLVAIAALFISVGGALMALLLTNESRMTRFEERQNANIRGLAELQIVLDKSQLAQDTRFAELRTALLQKLEIIGADVVILKITFATAHTSGAK